MHVTFFYAALFGLMFVALSVRTLRLRAKLGIAIGDAGSTQMLRAIRPSNFADPPSLLPSLSFTSRNHRRCRH